MGWNRVGVLTEVQGTMDAEQHCEILDGGMVESFEKLEMPEGSCERGWWKSVMKFNQKHAKTSRKVFLYRAVICLPY